MTRRIEIFALILTLAAATAHAADSADTKPDGTQPVMVKVMEVTLVDESAAKAGRVAAFGIVNPAGSACYAVALPEGATIEAGDTYALVPKSDLDETLRKDVTEKFPKCKVVDAVARVAHVPH